MRDEDRMKLKGSAYADRMTAGYLRTEFMCDECAIPDVGGDDERPRCPECGEYADPVMVTKYGRFLYGKKLP